MNTLRKIEIFVIVVIIALIGIVFAFKKPVLAPITNNNGLPNGIKQEEPTSTGALVPTNVIEYKGQDGQNALDLLKAKHKVEAKHYSFGDLVIGIDGITPDANHFWAMYINDQFSQVGASAYVTKSTDTIKWQIDEVSKQ